MNPASGPIAAESYLQLTSKDDILRIGRPPTMLKFILENVNQIEQYSFIIKYLYLEVQANHSDFSLWSWNAK